MRVSLPFLSCGELFVENCRFQLTTFVYCAPFGPLGVTAYEFRRDQQNNNGRLRFQRVPTFL